MISKDYPIETIQEYIDETRKKSALMLFDLVMEERKKVADHYNQGRPWDRGLDSHFVLVEIVVMCEKIYQDELLANGPFPAVPVFPDLPSMAKGLQNKEIIITAPMVDYLEKKTDFFNAAHYIEECFKRFEEDRTVEELENLMNAIGQIHGSVRDAEFHYLEVER